MTVSGHPIGPSIPLAGGCASKNAKPDSVLKQKRWILKQDEFLRSILHGNCQVFFDN
jgi:hypothetical protein